MELISLQFIVFLVTLLAAYYGIGRLCGRAQWAVLLAGSLAFYGVAGGWPLIALIAGMALVTWLASHGMARLAVRAKEARRAAPDRAARKALRLRYARYRRVVLIVALAACVLVLGYFKYYNVILFNLGLTPSPNSLGILLPLGISFYTFQSLGYLIDSYNEAYPPERSYLRYLLFVSWFPQIIQGPINRYGQLAPQLLEPHAPCAHTLRRALLRLGWGIFKKVSIASVLAQTLQEFLAGVNVSTPGSVVVFGILTYNVQMYADFSGGIDMVEGVSELFGVQMAQNFRQPYFAVSLADFWRRWHMTLGTWMRDYVFYPLALTRPMRKLGTWSKRRLRGQLGRVLPACIANVIVFLLVGLWHGAEAHYVAWGLYNGAVVALSDLLSPSFQRLAERLHVSLASRAHRAFAVARTFAVVSIGRCFDCITNVGVGLACLRNVLLNFSPIPFRRALELMGVSTAHQYGISWIAVVSCVIVFCVSLAYERGHDVRERVLSWSLGRRLALYLLIGAITTHSLHYAIDGGGFLYANF